MLPDIHLMTRGSGSRLRLGLCIVHVAKGRPQDEKIDYHG